MPLSATELAYQRRNTVAFIAANPVSLALIPRTRIKDGSGTRFQDGDPRATQTFRLIDQSTARNTIPGLIRASDGIERLVDFVLLGDMDAVVSLWDYWVAESGTYEVAEIYPANQYEVRAAVVRRA